MKRLTTLLALLALLAGATAVVVLLLRSDTGPAVELPTAIDRSEEIGAVRPRVEPPPQGGVYAGVVLSPDGEPVPDATVLLVAHGADRAPPRGVGPQTPEDYDPEALPRIGFHTAAEGRTDAAGRFHVAVDPQHAVRVVAAYARGMMPALVSVDGPRDDIEVRLRGAGSFVGTVVDAETGRPIAGADVSIYLQQRAATPQGAPGERTAGRVVPLSAMAVAQQWVVETLGERVWGLDDHGDAALHVWTDKDGKFRFGPVGDEVQLEFVITHAEYAWTDFDQTEAGHAKRTVVTPGETVERTFRLERGHLIEGIVVDESGRPVPDVVLEVEHYVQHVQHWWYRTRKRITRTRSDGRFHAAGLSYGPYSVVLRHPSFGTEFRGQVPQDAVDLRWTIPTVGAIRGRVEGLAGRVRGVAMDVVIESTSDDAGVARHEQKRVRLDGDGAFDLQQIRPGRWLAWVQGGGRSSQPQEVEVRGLEVTDVRFVLGGGGRLSLLVTDADGRVVDPAEVRLVRAAEDGTPGRPLGRFVTRAGELDADGVVPGRYVLEVAAPGFLTERTGVLDVREGGTTDAGTVRLRRRAWIRVTDVRGPGGRAPEGEVRITIQEGDGEAVPYWSADGGPRAVHPGPVTVRATASGGGAFESTVEVGDGETADVVVELR